MGILKSSFLLSLDFPYWLSKYMSLNQKWRVCTVHLYRTETDGSLYGNESGAGLVLSDLRNEATPGRRGQKLLTQGGPPVLTKTGQVQTDQGLSPASAMHPSYNCITQENGACHYVKWDVSPQQTPAGTLATSPGSSPPLPSSSPLFPASLLTAASALLPLVLPLSFPPTPIPVPQPTSPSLSLLYDMSPQFSSQPQPWRNFTGGLCWVISPWTTQQATARVA